MCCVCLWVWVSVCVGSRGYSLSLCLSVTRSIPPTHLAQIAAAFLAVPAEQGPCSPRLNLSSRNCQCNFVFPFSVFGLSSFSLSLRWVRIRQFCCWQSFVFFDWFVASLCVADPSTHLSVGLVVGLSRRLMRGLDSFLFGFKSTAGTAQNHCVGCLPRARIQSEAATR